MTRLRTVLLDLDDTIYPASSGVWEAIGDRIHQFMVEVAGIAPEDASTLRQLYYDRYGTSLNGLRAHHGVDPLHYMRFVHDLPLADYLTPDPRLRTTLLDLRRPPLIFTNADAAHAIRVLNQLEVADLIAGVIDIVALEWVNKPRPEAYHRAMRLAGEDDPRACVVIDDQPRNLAPAAALGMTTVLVGDRRPADGADHVIPALSDLLEALPALGRDERQPPTGEAGQG